jgi:hypothetical protein
VPENGEKRPWIAVGGEKLDSELSLWPALASIRGPADQHQRGISLHSQICGLEHPGAVEITSKNEDQIGMTRNLGTDQGVSDTGKDHPSGRPAGKQAEGQPGEN